MNRFSLICALACLSSCLQPVSEDAGSDSIALSNYCDAYLEYLSCTNPRQCGLADPDAPCDDIDRYPTVKHSTNCIDGQLLSIDAGLLVYDPKAAKRCFDRLSSSCDDGTVCTDVFLPTRALGQTCIGSADCIAGACDRSMSCPGVCVPLVGDGERPAAARGCEGALIAVQLDDGGLRCQPRFAHGEPCAPDDVLPTSSACIDPHDRCFDRGDGGVARCEPIEIPALARRGEPCAATRCQSGLACRADGGCGELYKLNEDCRADFSGCVANSTCVIGFQTGTCMPLAGEGAPCVFSLTCSDGLNCVDEKCTRARTSGETCAAAEDCTFGLRCSDGICLGAVCR